MTEMAFYTRLDGRGVVRVGGADAEIFLQGLVSNDVTKLEREECVYACLLSPQGKFLFDMFITRDGMDYVLECEGGQRAVALGEKLLMYRLRSAVEILVEEKRSVYAVFGVDIGVRDPRHAKMGRRSFVCPEDIEERAFSVWDEHRIRLSIPDGSRDLLVGKSTMDEGRMDRINAIDYKKGCYIGQELTARMHYRGLGKKHLVCVDLKSLPERADLRSSCGEVGLALIRDSDIV